MPNEATDVEITRGGIVIDDMPFPWHIEDGVTIQTHSSGLSSITVCIPVFGEIVVEGSNHD